MKPSNYNVFAKYEPDDVYLGYNSLSGGMYVFNSFQYGVVKELLKNSEYDNGNGNGNGAGIIKEKLVKGQFLIDDKVDELKILKLRNNMTRFTPNSLGLVITPTLTCNFNCHYCYVDRQRVSMDKKTINALKRFFKKKMEVCKSAVVCWTGGEPLIGLDVVEQLNPYFIKEARRKRANFECSMITNGYLLTPEYCQRLKNCGIQVLQITLDGHRSFHNKIRNTLGGQETYDRILHNIIEASNDGFSIILRTNIDKNNLNSIYTLIDEVAETKVNKDNIYFSPCMVHDTKTSKNNYCGNCFSNLEFSSLEPELFLYALKKGFKVNKQLLSTHFTFCGANTMALHVVDSHANILKCWCNLGNAENNKIGYIKENGDIHITDHNVLSRWMAWDPFAIAECVQCKALPVCMGGCMYYNLIGETDAIEVGCSKRKYNLEDMMKLFYINAAKNGKSLNDAQLHNTPTLCNLKN